MTLRACNNEKDFEIYLNLLLPGDQQSVTSPGFVFMLFWTLKCEPLFTWNAADNDHLVISDWDGVREHQAGMYTHVRHWS